MVTSLFAGVAIPAWDRQLVNELKDAVFGMVDGEPTKHITVRNDGGEIYRMVVANGPEQQDALLECFARRGFESSADGDRTVMTLSHLTGELRIP